MDRYFSTNLRLGVVGLGKLGAPMCACFASKGFEVVGCDVDENKVRAINEGRAPVDETDLQELITAHRDKLKAVRDIGECVRNTDITFVVTATPSGPDDRFSLEYILPVCEKIGYALRTKSKQAFHIVVITSTVMPGDTWGPIREEIERVSGRKCGESFGLCYSPEFIALGSVIRDFLNPDFVLLGASDPLSEARVTSVYKTISDAPIASMSPVNAEITKIAVNTFLCTKISFGNMLLRVCQNIPGSDCDVVAKAVGMDSRIGGKLLKGGTSYGGPCLPRDCKAFATLGQSLPLVVDSFNRAQIKWLADMVDQNADRPVCVLDMAYKPGTKVTTESAGGHLVDALIEAEVELSDFEHARTVVLTTPDPQYLDWDWSGKHVIDCWRMLTPLAGRPGYLPLGIGPRE